MRPAPPDVIIAGTGPVAATLGCALAASGWETVVIRREGRPSPAPDGDRRGLALTLASRQILTRLDVWRRLRHDAIGVIGEMRIEDMGGNEVRFEACEIGLPGLGYVVEYDDLMRALADRLEEHAAQGAVVLKDAAISAIEAGTGRIGLRLGPAFSSARLLVAADGAGSRLRDLAGIKAAIRPYEEGAIVTTVKTGRAHRGVAWQRFLATGPLALLPLAAPHERSLIWTLPLAQAQELAEMPDEAFARALELACKDTAGAIEVDVPRQMFALTATRTEHYAGQRIALIGDAAHQVHPLAGQGVNLGLGDAAALAELLEEARLRHRDPGAPGLLRRYERWRVSANTPMITAIDCFHRLFPDATSPLAGLRGTSLRVFDRLPLLKRAAMRFASGLTGDLPSLARPRS